MLDCQSEGSFHFCRVLKIGFYFGSVRSGCVRNWCYTLAAVGVLVLSIDRSLYKPFSTSFGAQYIDPEALRCQSSRMYFSSYTEFSPRYEDMWYILFRNMSFLDRYTRKGMTFTILGSDLSAIFAANALNYRRQPRRTLYLALLVAQRHDLDTVPLDWIAFTRCLQSHVFDESNNEIVFRDHNITLNIDNLLFDTMKVVTDPSRPVSDYYKNNTMQTLCASATIYGTPARRDARRNGSIYRHGHGYRIELKVDGHLRQWDLIPWWAPY